MTRTQEEKDTTRARVVKELQANPEGLSKSELRRRVGGNAGVFRRLIESMLEKRELTVVETDVPNQGPTRLHRLATDADRQIPGQESLEVIDGYSHN